MRYSMALTNRVRRSLPAMIALGALAFAYSWAQAEDLTELQEVTVTPPSVKIIGRDASGARIREVSASARVQYDPAMLASDSGRALLRDKVTDVARRLCRSLDTVAEPIPAEERACVQQAVDGAKMRIAAAAAQYKAG